MDSFKRRRWEELQENSGKNGAFYFTEFLSPVEISDILSMCKSNEVTLFGGAPDTERKMARFGDPEELGYEVDFPIAILRIEPLQKKFADDLTHRDFLGAILNLGLERSVIGDIVVRDKAAFVFVKESLTSLIIEELSRIKHTSVRVSVMEEVPEDVKPVRKEERLIVSSCRPDLIIAKLYHLSRQEAKDAFGEQRVFLNSRLCTNPSNPIKEGDVMSVRGHGKFVFQSIGNTTKKGNINIILEKYV